MRWPVEPGPCFLYTPIARICTGSKIIIVAVCFGSAAAHRTRDERFGLWQAVLFEPTRAVLLHGPYTWRGALGWKFDGRLADDLFHRFHLISFSSHKVLLRLSFGNSYCNCWLESTGSRGPKIDFPGVHSSLFAPDVTSPAGVLAKERGATEISETMRIGT